MNSKIFKTKIKKKHLLQHETKRHVLLKFFLVLFIFLIYFIFIAQKYGANQGFFIAVLSWSFFVLCTPVADAGFLIDFPLRLVIRIKMVIAEIFVWLIAISVNFYAYFSIPEIYNKTKILILFKHILDQPMPFWIIILLSMIGTFVSIKFGDELLDKANHKDRVWHKKHKYNHKFIIMIFLFVITFVLYDFLLKKLGIDLPI